MIFANVTFWKILKIFGGVKESLEVQE